MMQQQSLASYWMQLKQNPLNASVWQDLALIYAECSLPWHTRYAATQVNRLQPNCQSAMDTLLQQCQQQAKQENAVFSVVYEDVLARAEFTQSRQCLESLTALAEVIRDDWITLLYIWRLHDIVSDSQVPRPHLEQLTALEYIPGETAHLIARWRLLAGDAQGAVALLKDLVHVTDERPLRYSSMLLLGDALLQLGNTQAAELAFSRAALSPNPKFLALLAEHSFNHNYWVEAVALRRQIVQMTPNDATAWLALAQTESQIHESGPALQSCARALELRPDYPEALLLQAQLEDKTGEGESYFRVVLEQYEKGDPLSRLTSSVAMSSLYAGFLSAEQRADLHRRLCAPIEASITAIFPAAKPDQLKSKAKSLSRPLRVGYLSGDLHRQHPVNLFLLPVLERHHQQRVEVFIYHTGRMYDIYTERAKQAASAWRDVGHWDDAAIAQQIVTDQLDILIDTAGHTNSHRLAVMAMRPAPVTATFLGYPHSTGLTRIDYLIGDPIVSPTQHQHLYTEHIAQMPNTVFCWAPVDDYALPKRMPLNKDSTIVLGSFNNAMKLVPRTLQLWAKIMHSLPNAKLLIKAPSFDDPRIRQHFIDSLTALGVEQTRIELRGPCGLFEMMQEYADVDIALDPIPYNGGTTSLQALWMGTPVITLQGENFVGRMGSSFLHALGYPEWVAQTEQDFVDIVVNLAQQPELLNELHQNLRSQVQQSSVGDIERYTADFEQLLMRLAQTKAK